MVAGQMIQHLKAQLGEQMAQGRRADVENGNSAEPLIDHFEMRRVKQGTGINERAESAAGANYESRSINVEHIAGVVEVTEIPRLKKLIFRATKGKAFVQTEQFEDVSGVERPPMSVYIVLF